MTQPNDRRRLTEPIFALTSGRRTSELFYRLPASAQGDELQPLKTIRRSVSESEPLKDDDHEPQPLKTLRRTVSESEPLKQRISPNTLLTGGRGKSDFFYRSHASSQSGSNHATPKSAPRRMSLPLYDCRLSKTSSNALQQKEEREKVWKRFAKLSEQQALLERSERLDALSCFIDSKVPQEMQVQKAKAHILSVVVKASSVL